MSVEESGGGRRERRRVKNRSRLLHSACRVMLRCGYERTTIAAIAEEADLGFGTFYSHFSSKEEIYHALVEDASDFRRRFMLEFASGISDPADRIAVGAFSLVWLAGRDLEFTRFLLEARRRGENLGDDALVERLRAMLAEGFAVQRVRALHLDAALAAVNGAVLGLIDAMLKRQLPVEDAAYAAAEMSLRLLGIPVEEAAESAEKARQRITTLAHQKLLREES